MKRHDVLSIIIVLLTAIMMVALTGGFEIRTKDDSDYKYNEEFYKSMREKRQIESFDEDYSSFSNQETPEDSGFWDKVVKVALKLFNKFVQWLNSS